MNDHRPYHHGNLRNALIEAGIALLQEGGSADLDLREVARRVGVSRTAPYRHFPDKHALLVAIAAAGFTELQSRLLAASEQVPAPLDARLLALGRAYAHFGLERPAHIREMFSGLLSPRTAYPELYAASKGCFELLYVVFIEGQAAGLLQPSEDPLRQAFAAWSMLHGLTMLLVEKQMLFAEGDPQVVEDMIALCVRAVWQGLEPGT